MNFNANLNEIILVNYYEILGLKNYAEASEVKTAFRQLAKLYHPDKNPLGNDHFSKILKAYETLINPESKLKYDYKLNYDQANENKQTKPHPHFRNAEEQELKRRRYYEEHIKKYEKKKTQTKVSPEIKSSYNEFKYILFATPLAVILFLLIVNLASNDRGYNEATLLPSLREMGKKVEVKEVKNKDQLQKFSDVFGNGKTKLRSGHQLSLENKSKTDLMIYLFNTQNEFIRSVYIKVDSISMLSKLPDTQYYVLYCCGKENQVFSKTNEDVDSLRFYKSKHLWDTENKNALTLFADNRTTFTELNKEDFFTYPNNKP